MEKISAAKPDKIILREKDMEMADYLSMAEGISGICGSYGVPLILHTYRMGEFPVHLPMPVLRSMTEISGIFGASVHSPEEAAEAQKMGAAYVMAGHIFATDCKKGLAPRGLDFLRKVCRTTDIPVYAVGGITVENIAAVRDAGAAGACIMSGFMTCDDVAGYMEKLRERVK